MCINSFTHAIETNEKDCFYLHIQKSAEKESRRVSFWQELCISLCMTCEKVSSIVVLTAWMQKRHAMRLHQWVKWRKWIHLKMRSLRVNCICYVRVPLPRTGQKYNLCSRLTFIVKFLQRVKFINVCRFLLHKEQKPETCALFESDAHTHRLYNPLIIWG